jgi:hypothetical protein
MAQPTSDTLTVQFRLDNAAFVDDEAAEIAYVMETISRKVRDGRTSGKVIDSNGNTIGRFERKQEPLS